MAAGAEKTNGETPELTRRERRKREVRDRIVEAAVTLFEKQGPQATKVDEVCDLADVAQKTFFNHFATKQHLVSEVATTYFDGLFSTVGEFRTEDTSASERIAAFFSALPERCNEAGPMHRELILEMIRLSHLQHVESEQTRLIHDTFRSLLEDRRPQLREDTNIETLTELIVGTFYVLMLNWVSQENYPLEERALAAGRFLAATLTK